MGDIGYMSEWNDRNPKPRCPQCARFREKLDREKMAKALSEASGNMNRYCDYAVGNNLADAIIKYFEEG